MKDTRTANDYAIMERAYKRDNGLHCPYCGSDDIEGGHAEYDDNYSWRPVKCNKCGEEWDDIYTLSGIDFKAK